MALNKIKSSDNCVSMIKSINDNFTDLQYNKVSMESGKGLSTEDFTTEEKTKLNNLNKDVVLQDGTTSTNIPTSHAVVSYVEDKIGDIVSLMEDL